MKILSKVARVPGEVVELDGKLYGFERDEDGRPYCEVQHAGHIGILLAIRETFEVHPSELDAGVTAPVVAAPAPAVPEPVTEMVDDDEPDEGDDADEDVAIEDLGIEALRTEYQRLTGKEASPNAPAHILRKTVAKLSSSAAVNG